MTTWPTASAPWTWKDRLVDSRPKWAFQATSAFPPIASIEQICHEVQNVPETEVEDSIRSKAERLRRSSRRKLFGTVLRIACWLSRALLRRYRGELGFPRIPSA